MGNLLLHDDAVWSQECRAGAIYQRMATALLHDMMHNEVEVYVDDMIVKSKDRESHTINLSKFFERIKEYRLRLNPQKCTFGVITRKLLGFSVSDKGIKVDPSKIKALLEMPPPKSEKEIRSFFGRLQYISRFIAKLTSTCEPIFKVLRKNEPHTWNDECQNAFELIKEYLLHPPILVPPQHGKPLLLYDFIIGDAKEEAERVMEEVHQGICCLHMNGRMLAKKVPRIGYYWNTMEIDCMDYVKSCHDCQTHANLNHVTPSELYSMTSPWPFLVWGIDVIGRIAPKTLNGHKYILVAIDCLDGFPSGEPIHVIAPIGATFLRQRATQLQVAPSRTRGASSSSVVPPPSSTGTAAVETSGVATAAEADGKVRKVMKGYSLEYHKSSPYRPQANRAAEIANKNMRNILAKMVVTYKDWAEKLPFGLWGYRTSICASNWEPPYSLVYGSEAMFPIEVEIQSLRVLVKTKVLELG
ncbi:uncharacterized protein K02A2.6-like [Quercus lobata]|uniref:uncharacterized protein K02A2.6-like n=1 Tax=Quercus lobata TaxID=97700 RepID=UPI001246D53B|nr:uncharacterized protein K02A2.6-like [Quercus lobata]